MESMMLMWFMAVGRGWEEGGEGGGEEGKRGEKEGTGGGGGRVQGVERTGEREEG